MIHILLLLFASLILLAPQEAAAAGCPATALRWAASSNTMYVSGSDVTCTLTEIDQVLDKSPLNPVSPGVWFLGANLILQNGAILNLSGTSAGGDVDYLRLKSNSSGSDPVVFMRADWGSILMNSTKVTSWDEAKNGPDTESGSKRAYVHIRSQLSSGSAALESRMDILSSEVGYLGYNAAESYGLAWKVAGTGGQSLYDIVNVLGDVKNSNIHHNYFGAYTYGAYGMQWVDNEIHDNTQYGLDPHDDSDSLVITGNHVYNNGNHGIICSQRCDHLTITGNDVHHNKGNGIMLHRLVVKSTVEDNDVHHNGDSGVALFESHENKILNNRAIANKNGMRVSVGSRGNMFEGNEVGDNTSYGLYFYKGSDIPLSGNGRIVENVFVDNEVSDNGSYGLKMKESDDNTFMHNDFVGNGNSLLIEQGSGNRFIENLVQDNSEAGFSLSGAKNHVISKNRIIKNGAVGVSLKSSSNSTLILENTITDHTSYGIQIQSSLGVTEAGNSFARNKQNVKK